MVSCKGTRGRTLGRDLSSATDAAKLTRTREVWRNISGSTTSSDLEKQNNRNLPTQNITYDTRQEKTNFSWSYFEKRFNINLSTNQKYESVKLKCLFYVANMSQWSNMIIFGRWLNILQHAQCLLDSLQHVWKIETCESEGLLTDSLSKYFISRTVWHCHWQFKVIAWQSLFMSDSILTCHD